MVRRRGIPEQAELREDVANGAKQKALYLDDAEPVIGRAFARPVGIARRTNEASSFETWPTGHSSG